MIFNKQRKIAFVFPIKTGSFSTIDFLTPSKGWFVYPDKHLYASWLIENYSNLNEYSIYGFLRDPLKRFESIILHLKQKEPYDKIFSKFLKQNNIDKSVEEFSYEDYVDLFFKIKQEPNLLIFTIPQFYWMNHPKVTVLDFDNFESELRRIVGDNVTPMPTSNTATSFGKSVITDKVCAFVREHYAVDYALAKDRLGKEYNP